MLLFNLIVDLTNQFSSQIIKHLARLNGNQMFEALYSMTNEFEQIKALFLAPGTKLDFLRPLMASIVDNIKGMGYLDTRIVYTDNCCHDRRFYNEVFPSLNLEVRGTPRRANLEALSMNPANIHLIVQADVADDVCNDILADCATKDVVFMGLDCEWVFNSQTKHSGPLSTIQIAYGEHVYVFHVRHCALARPKFDQTTKSYINGALPGQLKVLLEMRKVIMVGRQVNGDINRIKAQFGADIDRGLELGSFARRKKAVDNGHAGLADLTAAVLKRELPKDQGIRLSNWDSNSLNDRQIIYAALDAYASLKIHEKLVEIPEVGDFITEANARQGLYVSLHPAPNTNICAGIGCIRELVRVKTKLSRVVVKVESISAPDVNIADFQNQKQSRRPLVLNSFIEVDIKYLRVAEQPQGDEGTQPAESEVDIDDVIHMLEQNQNVCLTRVLLDAFHWIKRITEMLDRQHGAYYNFCRALSNAVFIHDQSDMEKVQKVLAEKDMSVDRAWDDKEEYMMARVRRTIPQPEILLERIYQVLNEYRNVTDATTRDPLIDDRLFGKIERHLVHVRKGCLSDPPGEQLYYVVGEDDDGLTMYRCVRGTSSNEGTVHRHLKQKFGAFNAGVRLAFCMLLDFAARNNMRADHRNRGMPSYGHFDPWLLDRINEVRESIDNKLQYQSWVSTSSVTFKNYFIIGPYELHEDIPKHDPQFKTKNSAIDFLAERMDLKIPVTPVHTVEEFKLFKDLSRKHKLNMAAIRDEWNTVATGSNKIYMKLLYHIEKHQKVRDSASNRNSTIQNNSVSVRTAHIPVSLMSLDERTDIATRRRENSNDLPNVAQPAQDTDNHADEEYGGFFEDDQAPTLPDIMQSTAGSNNASGSNSNVMATIHSNFQPSSSSSAMDIDVASSVMTTSLEFSNWVLPTQQHIAPAAVSGILPPPVQQSSNTMLAAAAGPSNLAHISTTVVQAQPSTATVSNTMGRLNRRKAMYTVGRMLDCYDEYQVRRNTGNPSIPVAAQEMQVSYATLYRWVKLVPKLPRPELELVRNKLCKNVLPQYNHLLQE
jgi:ribonuclease D